MNIEQAKELLLKCKSADEWNAACNVIKKENNGGYPDGWYQEIIMTGFMDMVLGEGSSSIKIVTM